MEYLTEAKKDALRDLYAVWDELGHMPSVDEFNRSTIIRHVGDTKPSGRLSIAFGSPPEAFRAAARYRDDIEARKIIDPKYDPNKPLKIKPAEPEPEPEPEPKSELGSESESDSAPESEPESKPEPESESSPKPHSTKQRQHRGISRRSKSYRDSEEARYALQDELEKPEPSYNSICDPDSQKDANEAPEKLQERLAASSDEAGEEYVEYEELSNAEIDSETDLESASTESTLAPPLEVAEETIAEKEETFMEVGLATEDKIILNTLNKTLYIVKSDGTMAIVQRTGLATAMTGKINVGSVAGIPIAKIFTMPALIRDEELHEFPEKKDNVYYVVPIEVAEAANEIGRATDDLLYPLDYEENDEKGAIYCNEFGRL